MRGGGGGGRGLFGPDPENKVMVNELIWNLVPIMVPMILVNMQNFKLLGFLLLEILHHKNSPSRMEQVIAIRYLSSKTPEKSLFMPENIFPGTLFCISMVLKRNKINLYPQFFQMSDFNNNWSNSLGESILLKFC